MSLPPPLVSAHVCLPPEAGSESTDLTCSSYSSIFIFETCESIPLESVFLTGFQEQKGHVCFSHYACSSLTFERSSGRARECLGGGIASRLHSEPTTVTGDARFERFSGCIDVGEIALSSSLKEGKKPV